MSFSAYVDNYPVTAYIVGHLGLSVGDFCRRYEFDPTIVTGWQTAEQVRCILRLLEKQHFAYLAKNPAWNITLSLLAPPVSSQTTQREEA
ncbi:hypothetical protein [Enterococcus gallinarum]|uniref:hypothetical protein n=1 Tax=Enterococcus gallinarum TaxID=1353 RepID=UPI0022DFD0EC|nr:hypothetical protein [Enterococcus gallinarum]